jgi:hypothetical protein
MFVPSLSWQIFGFQYKLAQKGTLLSRLVEHVPLNNRWVVSTALDHRRLRENGTFLSFPYVCPEPVLVK